MVFVGIASGVAATRMPFEAHAPGPYKKHAHQPPAAPPPPRVMVFLPTAAYIVGLAVQCTFFGLALATFVLCIHSLTRVPFSAFTRSRWALFAVSIAMIAVGALSVGQAIAHNLEAFVYYKGGTAAMEELNLDQDPAIWIHVCPVGLLHTMHHSA
jgi:hypothetical protein